jgi:putative acetyltransferase
MDQVRLDHIGERDPRIEIVAQLFRDYAAELNEDLCFQSFEDELETLPGVYAPPTGSLILALDSQDNVLGCVALKERGPGLAELKRLYIVPEARGKGLATTMCQQILDDAKEIGYEKVCLDTLDRMVPAVKLYESMGFRRGEPYYDNPLQGVLYFYIDVSA